MTSLYEQFRVLLSELQDQVLQSLLVGRTQATTDELSTIAAVTDADTIYGIDKISEEAILDWFAERWPAEQPLELVMEGLEGAPTTFPAGTPVDETLWKAILDPIDGTRGLMYDKRPAWSLAGLAPQHGSETNLTQIVVAVMTELPTSKQWRADRLSAIRGLGPSGVHGVSIDVRSGSRESLIPRPSGAADFRHGFAAMARFFPQGKALLSQLEERLWTELHGVEPGASPLVFDDQYISTGGQIYELAVGHDRMQGDLRPLAYSKLGLESSLTCHPYDIATALVLTELGGIVETPSGQSLDAPLDVTSPISWIGFPNEVLAERVRPILRRLVKEML